MRAIPAPGAARQPRSFFDKLNDWAKEIAPSSDLIKWFGHELPKWAAFQDRYRKELEGAKHRERLAQILTAVGGGRLTLVFGARDDEHNQAVVLRDVILHLSEHVS